MARPRLGPNRQPWKGIDANERAYNTVHNALVGIILDGVTGVSPDLGHRQITPEKADEYLDRGRRVLADFESQALAPGGQRGRGQFWMENKIRELKRLLRDAESVRSGTQPQTQTPESYGELRKHLGLAERRKSVGIGSRARYARETHERNFSMTWGQLPPFKKFEHDISTRIDPDYDRPYLPEGDLYPMELVSAREIEVAQEFGGLESFRTSRPGYAYGFRGDAQQIYDFLKFLLDQEDAYNGEEGSPGDLASSIMYTLGYEWI
jgi:hypothetical protein